MYTEYFGFTEPPFSITPDPRYLYLSGRHREALAHLVYGVGESGGFVQLTGEVGTGKTTVIRVLMEQLPDNVDAAVVLNPRMTVPELLASICDELRVAYEPADRSPKTLIDRLNAYLLDAHARGRRTVLIIDEAQDLSPEVLEQVRLLTNLETARHKLLQIFLIGQPELKSLLSRNDLRQVAQRITARYHLTPLSRYETGEYIRHRLRIAGQPECMFTESAFILIHRLSAGIPRLINIICDRSLLGAYSRHLKEVDSRVVKRATREVMGDLPGSWHPSRRFYVPALLVLLGVVVGAVGATWFSGGKGVTGEPVALQQVESSVVRESSPPEVAAAELPPVAAPEPLPKVVITRAPDPEPPAPQVDEVETAPEEPVATLAVAGIDELLSGRNLPNDVASAFYDLFKLWGMADADPARGCTGIPTNRFKCEVRKGSWTTLRGINRPAVLELVDGSAKRHLVVLEGLHENEATLLFSGVEARFNIRKIDPYWYGDFLVITSEPPRERPTVRAGVRNDTVVWLRLQLARINGGPPPANPSDLFDQELKKQVIEFQQSRGLTADGIAGARTYREIAKAAAGDDLPVLDAGG